MTAFGHVAPNHTATGDEAGCMANATVCFQGTALCCLEGGRNVKRLWRERACGQFSAYSSVGGTRRLFYSCGMGKTAQHCFKVLLETHSAKWDEALVCMIIYRAGGDKGPPSDTWKQILVLASGTSQSHSFDHDLAS